MLFAVVAFVTTASGVLLYLCRRHRRAVFFGWLPWIATAVLVLAERRRQRFGRFVARASASLAAARASSTQTSPARTASKRQRPLRRGPT